MSHEFNPMSQAYHKNRYDHFPRLLKSHPLYYCEPAGGWVVSRYADVKQVLSQHTIYSSSPMQGEGFGFTTAVDENATPEDTRRMQTLISALPFKMEET